MEILSLFWGFRLTIWNVNRELLRKMLLAGESFRLTIWNVNFGGITIVPSGFTCFILTIWA
ncbi:hypothetical protein KWL52_009565 [Clostridioides difficile]|nr:hypothetical protein [Clostridioides difficile]HBE7903703.1 hypothetical protein [Clostridioides difficile]HBG1173532.1 hypothetical protein [Clostridioides difficile]HBG1637760.1 hypothetical protein [Clostridioides difficile]